nr:uncharacterized protein LOC107279659 [Oryza sativa Japonica Group]
MADGVELGLHDRGARAEHRKRRNTRRRLPSLDPSDTDWLEVQYINSYGVLMGYMTIAVNGLGFLVVTWTTVVLLGGFVSMLGKKDFWCLTLSNTGFSYLAICRSRAEISAGPSAYITVMKIQAAMLSIVMWLLFAIYLYGLYISAGISLWRLIERDYGGDNLKQSALDVLYTLALLQGVIFGYRETIIIKNTFDFTYITVMKIQAAMLSIVMWLLFAIYLYGLYISAGISLWRLIERDYGGDNLKQSALDVLYTLALLQGVIFGYRETFANFKGSLVDAVSLQYDEPDLGVAVLQYLQEIRSGCAKNPSFAAGRNLVTFAVDLLESKSGDGYVRGLEILGALLRLPIMETSANSGDRRRRRVQLGQLVLIRQQLTASASFGHIVHRLLVTLGPRSPYNRRIRECAATIVLHVAGEILVEQFRRGIHCISSLLDPYGQCCLSHDRRRPAWLPEAYGRSTVLEPYEREWLMETWKSSRGCDQEHDRPDRLSPESDEKDDDHCKDMMFLGMLILGALAVDDVNRTAMANSRGLIAKLIAPVSLDLLHSVGHGAWSKIMSKSLQVMNLLVDAPGEAGTDLRHEMLGNKKAISAMEAILECDQCGEKLQMLAMEILAALAIVDSGKDCASREEFVQMLLCAFSDCSRGIGVRAAAAAEALVMLSSKMEGSAMIIMKANNNSVDNLVKILLDRDNIILFRVATAVILERLCANYTEDDECLQNLKGVMTKAMPKIKSPYHLRFLQKSFIVGQQDKNCKQKRNLGP